MLDPPLIEPEQIERRTRSRWTAAVGWVSAGSNALIVMASALVLLMAFQSTIFYFNRRDDRKERKDLHGIISKQSDALADLGRREGQDQQLFDLFSRLILLSGQTTPQAQAERQQVIDQLRELQAQRSQPESTGNPGPPGKQGPPGPPGPPGPSGSSSPTTSPPSTTTTRPNGVTVPCVTVPGVKPGC